MTAHDTCLFCRLSSKGVNGAWLGLIKSEDTCDSTDVECRRRDWSWLDGTEYQYPNKWNKWPLPSYEPSLE